MKKRYFRTMPYAKNRPNTDFEGKYSPTMKRWYFYPVSDQFNVTKSLSTKGRSNLVRALSVLSMRPLRPEEEAMHHLAS